MPTPFNAQLHTRVNIQCSKAYMDSVIYSEETQWSETTKDHTYCSATFASNGFPSCFKITSY